MLTSLTIGAPSSMTRYSPIAKGAMEIWLKASFSVKNWGLKMSSDHVASLPTNLLQSLTAPGVQRMRARVSAKAPGLVIEHAATDKHEFSM